MPFQIHSEHSGDWYNGEFKSIIPTSWHWQKHSHSNPSIITLNTHTHTHNLLSRWLNRNNARRINFNLNQAGKYSIAEKSCLHYSRETNNMRVDFHASWAHNATVKVIRRETSLDNVQQRVPTRQSTINKRWWKREEKQKRFTIPVIASKHQLIHYKRLL